MDMIGLGWLGIMDNSISLRFEALHVGSAQSNMAAKIWVGNVNVELVDRHLFVFPDLIARLSRRMRFHCVFDVAIISIIILEDVHSKMLMNALRGDWR